MKANIENITDKTKEYFNVILDYNNLIYDTEREIRKLKREINNLKFLIPTFILGIIIDCIGYFFVKDSSLKTTSIILTVFFIIMAILFFSTYKGKQKKYNESVQTKDSSIKYQKNIITEISKQDDFIIRNIMKLFEEENIPIKGLLGESEIKEFNRVSSLYDKLAFYVIAEDSLAPNNYNFMNENMRPLEFEVLVNKYNNKKY